MATPELRPLSAEEKVAFLSRPQSYPELPATVEVIETHMSSVFLSGTYVYKFKKPVRRAFLDLTTLESRRRNCAREVRLNRRLAPDVYLGVVSLTRSAHGVLALDGKGATAEWLVKMRRLPAHRMLDRAIRDGAVGSDEVQKVAALLARFYRRAERVTKTAQAYRGRFLEGVEENRRELMAPQMMSAARVNELTAAQNRFLAERGGMLDARALEGRIVDAHGDLRPEHICLNAEPKIIDCLEFERELRLLDPADELAFLAMECERIGGAAFGQRILEACLAAGHDHAPAALISFYKAFRACVRAKLAIWHLPDCTIWEAEKWRGRANDYLALAARHASMALAA